MDDNKVTSCNANFLDFFFKGYLLDLTDFFFFFAGRQLFLYNTYFKVCL